MVRPAISVASSADSNVALEPETTTSVPSSPFSEATARSHSAICCTSSTITTRGSPRRVLDST